MCVCVILYAVCFGEGFICFEEERVFCSCGVEGVVKVGLVRSFDGVVLFMFLLVFWLVLFVFESEVWKFLIIIVEFFFFIFSFCLAFLGILFLGVGTLVIGIWFWRVDYLFFGNVRFLGMCFV